MIVTVNFTIHPYSGWVDGSSKEPTEARQVIIGPGGYFSLIGILRFRSFSPSTPQIGSQCTVETAS
jgi:hypothetical protein